MKVRLDIIIKGEINSRELYERLRCYEPCVTDIGTETYVCASVDITPCDADKIIEICKEYGVCDVDTEVLPIIVK